MKMKTEQRTRWERIEPTPDKLPVGVYEDGEVMNVKLTESNLLVAGIPGSGKSVTFASVYAQIAQLPNVATLNFDPKLVELRPWRERASFNSSGACCFPYAMRAVKEEMDRRYRVLASRGMDKFTPEDWAEYPQLVLAIDELAKFFKDPDDLSVLPSKTETYQISERLVAEGRACGISLLMATQKPSARLMPTELRDLIAQRIAHSVSTSETSKMILGSVDLTDREPHKITASEKGVGYFIGETDKRPQRFRTALVLKNEARDKLYASKNPDPRLRAIAENYPTVEEIATATRHHRVALPFLDNNYEFQQHMEQHRIEDERYEEEERLEARSRG